MRQLDSLCEYTEDKLAESDVIVEHIEGKGESGWVLMDYGDVIINLFTNEQRDKYQLERIWKDCERIEL